MKRETYKGRKIKVVAGRGADCGYTRVTLNGVDMGKWMQSEDEALRSTRGTIDHADEVGVSSGRYGAEHYAPGTYELCDEGHAKEIDGECGHTWCVEQRAKVAPVVEETPAKVEHRETTITVAGVERVVRTEIGGKVRTTKQLEAAHTKAVKAALVEMRQAKLDERYTDMVASAQKPQEDAEGFPGSGERRRQRAQDEADAWRSKYGTAAAPKNVPTNFVDASKGFPKVTFTSDIPEYLVELAPGHYATPDAAASMGVAEHVDEVLPGLALTRYGKGWILRHLPSVTDQKPNTYLGPVFKTRKRAREVALTDLARFDFTRSQAEITADVETAAVVKLVKWREFVAASKRNAWAEGNLREAEEAVSALSVTAAA
ncbi:MULTISPECIES: hypothetical protein [unclassified Streptomyces]|uniref:hypothetical protein n=1 Tax=unclassified Streptomyces TaxID=2593676 RepID=UPI0036E933A0